LDHTPFSLIGATESIFTMPLAASRAFTCHVNAVQHYSALTALRYAALHRSNLVTHPVCCFGDPAEARIVTVGLNPSDGEFDAARQWPTELSHAELADRCASYFIKPHEWFMTWTEALSHLGMSYQEGSAVHLDLSPRATRPVSDFKEAWEQELFLEMVERDLWTFFGTLGLCRKVEWVLMAGTVTGKYYINEFLQRHAPDYGYSLDGAFNRMEHPGRGKVAWHTLTGGGRALRVFFCSSSPSDRPHPLLAQRLRENQDRFDMA
jgi:hypothetical protein